MKVFKRSGPINTDEIVRLTKELASGYEYLVVASITGDSAIKVAENIKHKKIVCVTCPQGMHWEVDKMQSDLFAEIPELKAIRNEWLKQGLKQVPMDISEDNRRKLEALEVDIIQGTIPFFGPSFSMRLHLQQVTSLDVIAKTLELISTGTLVCLECVMMAVDAGILPENEHVLALAGTERGLDTIWELKSSASANLFHPSKGSRFVELFAKPGIALQPDINIEYLR